MNGKAMHEMSIAQSIIEILREEMRKCDAEALKSIRLKIGRMSAVVPDSLSFCFELITEGTDMEGAELIMDIIPLTGLCDSCGTEFEIEDYAFECPACGSKKIDTIAGRELSIVEIEVE